MGPLPALSLLAALISAASGAMIAALNPGERANRAGALLMGSVAWWAGCEVMWQQAATASDALAWHRVAALGFVFIGPHAARFVIALHKRGLPRLERAVPIFYGVNAIFLGLTWSGALMLDHMEPAGPGWRLVPGPLLIVWLAQTAGVVAFALTEWVRTSRRTHERSDAVHARRVAWSAALAAAIAGASDVVVPTLGIAAPRVGSLAVSLIGLAVIVSVTRLGASRLNAAGLAQRILHTLPDGVAMVRPSGRIRVANPSMADLLGCREADVEGRRLADHVDLSVLDPAVEYRARDCQLLQDSGFEIPVSISTTAVDLGGAGAGPDVLVIARDVREVAALRDRLATSERLALVGQLAGGIAHEINNPLAFIRSNLQHLQRESGHLADKVREGRSGELVRDYVAEVEEVLAESLEGIARAMHIVQDVTTFSQAGGEVHGPVDLREPIEHALRVARLGVAPGVEIHVPDLPADLEVNGSLQHLKQLFLNLLVNAIQAVGDRGRISIVTRSDAGSVWISVTDDGCGIAPDDISRIFFPFFTTRSVGDGSGLGLAVCHEIARSHGGRIDVSSEEGRGTRVDVTLPRAGAQV